MAKLLKRSSKAEDTTTTTATEEPKKKGLWRYIFQGFTWFLLTIAAAAALVIFVLPVVLGATPMTILTQSMQPTLDPGDLVIVKPVQPNEIKIGDVVTVQPKSGDPELITHRVVGVNLGDNNKSGILTRGDNNNQNDPMWKAEQVRGKVLYSVPKVGWIRQNPKLGWTAVALLLGYFLVALFMPSKEEKKEKAEAKRREEEMKAREERLIALEAELTRRNEESKNGSTAATVADAQDSASPASEVEELHYEDETTGSSGSTLLSKDEDDTTK